MSDISIKIDGLMVRDVQPTTVSDLFQGEQVAVFGQYSGSGKKNVTIEGFWNGEKRKLAFEVEFPERSDSEKHAFVPRLWAGQQVDFLLREIRKQDKPEQELVDEVVRLAKRYGIVTPYTTFLMGEDLFDPKPKYYYRNRVIEQAQSDVTLEAAPALKRAVTESAKDQSAYRQSNATGSTRGNELLAEKELRRLGREETSSLQAIRYIGNRTFYKQGEYWLESEFEEDKSSELTDVEVGSPEYFKLVEADETIPKFLALEQLIVNVKGRWYRIQQRKKS
jgi:Ca-activated chloride channel family protein